MLKRLAITLSQEQIVSDRNLWRLGVEMLHWLRKKI